MTKTKKNIPFSILHETVEKYICKQRKCSISPKPLPVLHDVVVISHRMKIVKSVNDIFCFHNLFVLKIHIAGSSKGYVGKQLYSFLPGEGILIFPFQMHKVVSAVPEGQLRLVINFSMSLADQSRIEALRNKIFKITPEDCLQLSRIVELSHSKSDARQREAINILTEFLMSKLHKCAPEDSNVPSNTASLSVGTVFDYIHKHYREKLSVKEIAEKLGYSEAGIRLIFRRETGRTPGSFIQELILHDAAELLLYTDKTIQTISRECGFTNSFIFSRAFKNKIGKSPKAFRESLRKK